MKISSSPQWLGRIYFFPRFLWFWAVGGLLFLTYLPIFLVTFAMHNDYSLLVKRGYQCLGFVESEHLLVIGRQLGALLVNIPYHHLRLIADFVIWREIGFLFMLAYLAVIWFYCEKKWELERPWAAIIVAAIGLLPVSTVYVIWVCQMPPGFPNALVSSAAYILWDRAREQGFRSRAAIIKIILSFLLFITALYIYPPTALAVFIFTFGYGLWSTKGWGFRKKVIVTDVCFFGIGMIIYRFTERMLVTPWFLERIDYRAWQEYQKMGIASDVVSKGMLLKEVIGTSIAGAWHFYLGSWGAVIFLVFVAAGLWKKSASLIANKQQITTFRYREGIKNIVFLLGIILFVNAPVLLPEGFRSLIGYRVIFGSSVMGVMTLIWALRVWWQESPPESRSFWVALAGGMVLVFGVLVLANFIDVTKNYSRELHFIRAQISEVDPQRTQYYFFVSLPEGQTYIKRRLPFEYSLMINCPQHFAPVVWEEIKPKGIDPQSVNCYIIDAKTKSDLPRSPNIKIIDPMDYLAVMGLVN